MSARARWGRTVASGVGAAAMVVGAVLLTGVARDSLTIGGRTTAPMIGVSMPLDVTFTNGYEFPISVSDGARRQRPQRRRHSSVLRR